MYPEAGVTERVELVFHRREELLPVVSYEWGALESFRSFLQASVNPSANPGEGMRMGMRFLITGKISMV